MGSGPSSGLTPTARPPGTSSPPLGPVPGDPNTTTRIINPTASTVASSVYKLKVRGKELEAEFEKLTKAIELLREPVEYCEEGDIEGFPDLKIEKIDTFTDAIKD